ncbi:hypothetical protein [Mycobacterium sp. 155]|uniref:hypothetical protein n=1 Tax=Mycobacterium sp. 155 TaxID=1157943 RepID=UPI00035FEFDA|nr:hypothetical protein [Mycobacterium sp. 155]
MATVNGMVSLFVMSWLTTWFVLMVIYLGVLTAVNTLNGLWRHYQQQRQRRRKAIAELTRIDRQATAAVESIYVGYALAQTLIRDEITLLDRADR